MGEYEHEILNLSLRLTARVYASAQSRQSLRRTDNRSLEVNEGLFCLTSSYVCVHVQKQCTIHMRSILSRATLGSPVKHHLNGVSLVNR